MIMIKSTKNISLKQFVCGIVLITEASLLSTVEAEIFKCTTKQGDVFYNDKPCPVSDEEKKIKAEKDIINGYVPPGYSEAQARQAHGVTVGKSFARNIESSSVQEDKDKDVSNSSQESKINSNSSAAKNHSQGSGFSSNNLSQKGLKTADISKNLEPPRPKLKKSVSGSLSIEEKRAKLGIYPVDR